MDAYTIPEAADLTGLTPKEVRLLIEEGGLKAFRLGGRHRIARNELVRSGLLDPPEPEEQLAQPPIRDSTTLETLRARLDDIERRLEVVEDRDGDPRRPPPMRPALEPLFAPPRRRFERPT